MKYTMRKYNKNAFKLKYKITIPRIISIEAYKRILTIIEYLLLFDFIEADTLNFTVKSITILSMRRDELHKGCIVELS
jgi:hypothetical protein